MSKAIKSIQLVKNLSNKRSYSYSIDEIQKLKPLKKDHQIIDGHWLMAATNLPKGERLGRLKEWLYRLQIEHDLSTIHEVSELLCKIQWMDVDFQSWPKLSLL